MANLTVRSLLFFLLFFTAASARADLLGTWSCVYSLDSGGDYPSDLHVASMSGGSFSGVGRFTDTLNDFSSVTGTISGSTVVFVYDYYSSSYSATVTGTLNGNRLAGQWSSNSGQTGPFVCNRTGAKRASSVRIICNRSGDLLSAVCGATVGDADAPPRKTPTGTVTFTSKPGAPAFSSLCQLQPTSFSPGVSSCTVQYTPPQGFPVGAAFPLDAVYEGDENLAPSATDHKLLMATCSGDAAGPCSGAIGLDFGDESIGIMRNALSLKGFCGETSSSFRGAARLRKSSDCEVSSDLNLSIVDELSEFSEDEWRDMADSISNGDAKADEVLRVIREIGDRPAPELEATLRNSVEWAGRIQKANRAYMRRTNRSPKTQRMMNATLRYSHAARQAKTAVPKVSIAIASARTVVKSGSERLFSAKLNGRARRIMRVLKQANQASVKIRMEANVKRRGERRGRKLSTTQSVLLH